MNDATNIEKFLIAGTSPDIVERYRTLAARADKEPLALVEDEIVVLDTETTGLSYANDALIEIAALRMRGPEIVDRFQTFVNPGRRIPEKTVELTRITQADVADAPEPAIAVESFAQFAGSCDLVAHNASFDRNFIMRQLPDGVLTGTWIDTLLLSHIALPRFTSHRLADLSCAFGVHHSSHRAVDDVEALAALWRILLLAIRDMPPGLARLIAKLSPQTSWPARTIFQTVAAAQPDVRFSLRGWRREHARMLIENEKYDAKDIALSFASDDEIADAFSSSGIAAQMYPDYEQRSEQLVMAREVSHAFAQCRIVALEAGTGVGKSMAYLLPAALAARRNEITIGIATKTNALMDQLVYQELPRLSRALDSTPLRYVALKGYEHYLCLRKLECLARETENGSLETLEMLATLYAFAAQGGWTDLDAVNLRWYGMPRARIEASPNDCLKNKCPFFPKLCFLHGARRAASSADIVVTNHALLFRNVQMDCGILPPIRHWIVDEAHAVESEARRQLSTSISARDLEQALHQLAGARGSIVDSVRTTVNKSCKQTDSELVRLDDAAESLALDGATMLFSVTNDIEGRVGAIRTIAASFFTFVKDLGVRAVDHNGSYERVMLWVSAALRDSGAWACLEAPGRSLVEKLGGLVDKMRDLVSRLEQFEGVFSAQQADLANVASKLAEMRAALALVLDGSDESYVYSVELNRNPDKVGEALHAEKLDIGEELAESFYPELMSAVFTSATLATARHDTGDHADTDETVDEAVFFKHFCRTSGLDRLPPERVHCRMLESSYDFDQQMAVYLPTQMPEPNAAGYHDALARLLVEIHVAMGGSVLTLFTNRREMESLYCELKPVLREHRLDLVAQTRATSMKNLRDRFVSDEQLSLFALRSFWEGFDAPGDTLRCVIIAKLPFGRPSDPLACERKLRESHAAWWRYSLPEAVMDLKQAAGRLIRNSTDRGYLVIADSRVQTKGYGKAFLNALPTKTIRSAALDEIIADIRHGV